ncbi:MAG TPA: hypothetical protein VF584_07115 [Longimicrobium sp.]|jgi:hypothetical protein
MSTNPFRAADTTGEVHKGARKRMLAARNRVRRYFSPEAITEPDPDEAEVIGQRNVIADGKAAGGR